MKSLTKIFPALLALILFGANMVFADFKVGQTYHGFTLTEKRFVEEVNADCYLFSHAKSGARLLKIASDDPNKTFSIAFKTLPESDAGTPHIMEHSVLNGSKNFPVKSPFDVLSKGSLNTFLNAMTGSYLTIYPVASMNDKDFFNLMHVYLDAVFNPLIYNDPRILKQEGWHHELTSKDEDVVYKGVVYNEMKGAFSNPTRELGYQVDKNLFPDNPFHFSSGGYPAAIPSLTYEDFLNFHKKYYHPSNSYIYLYGNADLEKELAFIDAEYLSKYKKSNASISIPLQKPFNKMKEVNGFYSATEGSDVKDQTYLALNFVAGLNIDQELSLALRILEGVLINQESAPVRLALQEAGIGREVQAFTDDLQQNVFQIRVQNANPEDKEKFRDIVFKTLRQTIENGLDKEAVEGTLNRIEFRMREGDDAQKGVTYNFRAINEWFFAADPFLSLEYEKPLAKIKKGIKSGYLESVIKKYFLDNNHVLLLTLQPKPGLEKENEQAASEELSAYKASLTEQDVEKLVDETLELVEYQKREDSPEAVETIPMLTLQDITPEVEWYSIDSKKVSGIPVLYHDTFTNNVVYLRFYYDARVLPTELVPYASLLAEVMGSLDTKNYSFGELDKTLNLHTGGFSTFTDSYLEDRDDEKLLPKFVLSSKAMSNKVDKMFELVEEIVNNTNYADMDRLQAVLTRHQSRLDGDVKRNGFGYARTRLHSYYSNEGWFNEKTEGIDYYWFITDLVNNFDTKKDEILGNLQKTATLLFTKENLITSVTGNQKGFKAFSKGLKGYAKSQPEGKSAYQTWDFQLDKKNEGLLSASKVQYVLKGYDFKKLGYKWDGKMRVLNQILSTEWLQNQVRVIGGAYGGFSSISSTGTVYFASYRDPNLKETLDNYDATPNYLHNFEASPKEMTRYIIGTIARLDRPVTPSEQGDRAVRRYFQKMTKENLQKERNDVLAASADDIKNMEKMISEILEQDIYCVYGSEDKIQSNKELFKNIVKLNP